MNKKQSPYYVSNKNLEEIFIKKLNYLIDSIHRLIFLKKKLQETHVEYRHKNRKSYT